MCGGRGRRCVLGWKVGEIFSFCISCRLFSWLGLIVFAPVPHLAVGLLIPSHSVYFIWGDISCFLLTIASQCRLLSWEWVCQLQCLAKEPSVPSGSLFVYILHFIQLASLYCSFFPLSWARSQWLDPNIVADVILAQFSACALLLRFPASFISRLLIWVWIAEF